MEAETKYISGWFYKYRVMLYIYPTFISLFSCGTVNQLLYMLGKLSFPKLTGPMAEPGAQLVRPTRLDPFGY